MLGEKTAARTCDHTYGGGEIEDQAERKKHEDKLCNSVFDLFGNDADAVGYECKVYEDGTDNN